MTANAPQLQTRFGIRLCVGCLEWHHASRGGRAEEKPWSLEKVVEMTEAYWQGKRD